MVIDQIFKTVITLDFLRQWGIISVGIDPIEGFIRFLLLILLFALLFKAVELLKLGKNIAIVVALVVSLMTVIFIPGTVLLTIATTYGTIFSLVLTAVPLLLFGYGRIALKENPWLRLLLSGSLLFVLSQMPAHLGSFTNGATDQYGTIVNTVKEYLGYALVIAWIAFLWDLGSALFGTAKGETAGEKWNSWKDWKKNPVRNYIAGRKARAKTKLLNEYLADKKETNLLHDAELAVKDAVAAIESLVIADKIENANALDEVKESIRKGNDSLQKARDQYKTVNRTSWRSNRLMEPLLKKAKTVGGENVEALLGYEREIIKLHAECAQELEKVLAVYNKIEGPYDNLQKGLKKLKTFPYQPIKDRPAEKLLNSINQFLMQALTALEEVYKKQVAIEGEVKKLVSGSELLWRGAKEEE